jgi:hypothetical protein
MSDVCNMIGDATKVLAPLIKECEKLIGDSDLSPRTRSELTRMVAGWKIELDSGHLSVTDLCGLIESIYQIIVSAKKQCPRFDAHYPANIKHLEKAQTFVSKVTGRFLGSIFLDF